MGETKKKRLNIQIDADLHRKLKAYAALTDRTMSEAVVELIDKELEENERINQEKIGE